MRTVKYTRANYLLQETEHNRQERLLNSIDGLKYIGSGKGGHWEYNGK